LAPVIRVRWNTDIQKDYSCLVDCLKEINNYELNRTEFFALKKLSVFQSAGDYELILVIEDNVILKLFYIYARDSTKTLGLSLTALVET